MCCPVCWATCILVIVGALNWGLVGFFDFNLVSYIFGDASMASRAVYGLVGIAGLLKLFTCVKKCPACCKGKDGDKGGTCCGN
ncbi:MAG: DUF378 domain-containing protein [Deltaproteobacteria bacterium CG11_big_fil_rev_8_21_14_0_20_47_16]|nr:MAG: DUF378 domain-containing protein [Deltaproteobacteria bacterium CG11_big_fil_rev_8_21_14_0_20_47_16]